MTDPRGLQVVLLASAWEHIQQRPGRGMVRLEHVLETIEDPLLIAQDRNFPTRECYYRAASELELPIAAYLKVVVERGWHPARVVTAYPVDRPHRSEVLVWRREQ